MSIIRMTLLACGLALACSLGFTATARAQVGVGTWERQKDKWFTGSMTMTVEACCNGGRKLTYQVDANGTKILMTVESPFDGTEVPVMMNGKPIGETMAIKRVDDHHIETVLKMNGQVFATSKATLSADGKTLTVENNASAPPAGMPKGVSTETWIRK